MTSNDFPPAGPITDNVDMHLTKADGVFAVELFSMRRVEEGQEETVDSIGEVRIEADDSVPGNSYDVWFSYWHYMGHRSDYPFSVRLHKMLDMAGQLGLAEVKPKEWWEKGGEPL